MSSYLLKRLIETAVVIFIMSFVIYCLIGLMPGDPIDLMIAADPHLTSADAARLKASLGLDQPLLKRYGAWLMGALSGDFGYSRIYAQGVLEACDQLDRRRVRGHGGEQLPEHQLLGEQPCGGGVHQRGLDLGRRTTVELAVQVGCDARFDRHGVSPRKIGRRIFFSRARARTMRVLTVLTGMSAASATSAVDSPSR